MGEFIEFCSGLTKNPEIIESLKKSPVEKIIRRHLQGAIKRYKEQGVLSNDMFDTLPGTVLIYLENKDVVCFDVSDLKCSIITWYELNKGKDFFSEYHPREICEHLRHDDPKFSNKGKWDHIIGKTINKISIIEYDGDQYRRDFKDSFQKAIILETDEGDIVLSDLPGNGAMFPLIRKSQIPKDILDNSKIIDL